MWDEYTVPPDENAEGWLSDPVVVSPDDTRVACTRIRARVVVWDVATRKPTVVSVIPPKAEEPEGWHSWGVAFGPTGALVAWGHGRHDEVPAGKIDADTPADRRGGAVRIDLPGGAVVPLGMGTSVYTRHCAIDPTGTWLAAVGSARSDKRWQAVRTVRELRVYHLASGRLAYREQVEGLPLSRVAFTPSGKRLVGVTWKGEVTWWDVSEK